MKHIFWGCVFVFFHFRIQGFDLLPDFLGYLFISYGLYTLTDNSSQFKNAMCCSIGMVILQAVHLLFLFILPDVLMYLILDAAGVMTSILLFYFIAKGLKELETQNLLSMNTDIFMNIWIFQSISLLFGLLVIFSTNEFMLYASAFAAMAGIGANLVFLFVFQKARTVLSCK